MKKLFLSIIAVTTILTSCSNEEAFPVPEMVTITLDCSLDAKSTRAGESLYTQLYNKLSSKELIADSYQLIFTNKSTNEKFTLHGNWNDNTQFEIKAGTYNVTGYSTAEGLRIQDKCSLVFNTEVPISSNTSRISLKADYDCFLLIFDKKTVKNATITYISSSNLVEKHFFELDGMYYAFSNKLYSDTNTQYQKLTVEYTNGRLEEFQTNKLNTKKGEYYIFDSSASSELLGNSTMNFTLDQMKRGQL